MSTGPAAVLVVDDDEAVRETVCDILEIAGIDAAAVGTAEAGVAWCEAHRPELVVVDQRLPDAAGTDLAGRLKRIRPDLSILLLTGYVSAESAIAAVGVVDEYLTKPVPPAELVKAVRSGMERSRLRGENQALLERLRLTNAQLEATVEERTSELLEARDRAMEASRLKSEFLANMSHEIRTPLNGVVGVADLLGGTALTAEQREYVNVLVSSGEALLVIINDVLDLSKIEAGKLELEETEFNLVEVVDEVATLLGRLAFAKGVELVAVVDPALPELVTGDPLRLRQVLTNLVGNAVKFTDHGEVVVRAGLTEEALTPPSPSPRSRCWFSVSDSGIGMSPDDLPRLFSTFTQLDASDTRRHGGTGLGLVISQRLVRLMGGDITCESALGRGTTFRFALAFPGASGAAAVEPSLGGKRVVVAAASEAVRSALARPLARWGAQVQEASDAAGLVAAVEFGRAAGGGRLLSFVDQPLLGTARIGAHDDAGLHVCALRPPGSGAATDDGPVSLALTKPVRMAAVRSLLELVASPAGEVGLDGPERNGRDDRTRRTVRILVVEDNNVNQLVAVRMLHKLGWDADVASNGEEAITAVAAGAYAVVLMDCQMPVMDGFAATAAIRAAERERGTVQVPVIAVTATATTEDKARCLAAGMDDYLTKPLTTDRIDAVLQRWAPSLS